MVCQWLRVNGSLPNVKPQSDSPLFPLLKWQLSVRRTCPSYPFSLNTPWSPIFEPFFPPLPPPKGYPEARATLDLEALQLQPFYAGARVWFDGGWHTVRALEGRY